MKHKEKEESREKVYKGKGTIHNREKNMDKGNHCAADAFRWATRLIPIMRNIFSYLGYALPHTKKASRGRGESQKVISIEPSNPEHYINIGRIYKRQALRIRRRIALKRHCGGKPENEAAFNRARQGAGIGLAF